MFADSGHRLFLMNRRMTSQMTSDTGPSEEFTVLGATANGQPCYAGLSLHVQLMQLLCALLNCAQTSRDGCFAAVYSVSVGKHPNCTCPDFEKGNVCKHYLFVMLRVLRLDEDDPLVWQKALLKREVDCRIFELCEFVTCCSKT